MESAGIDQEANELLQNIRMYGPISPEDLQRETEWTPERIRAALQVLQERGFIRLAVTGADDKAYESIKKRERHEGEDAREGEDPLAAFEDAKVTLALVQELERKWCQEHGIVLGRPWTLEDLRERLCDMTGALYPERIEDAPWVAGVYELNRRRLLWLDQAPPTFVEVELIGGEEGNEVYLDHNIEDRYPRSDFPVLFHYLLVTEGPSRSEWEEQLIRLFQKA